MDANPWEVKTFVFAASKSGDAIDKKPSSLIADKGPPKIVRLKGVKEEEWIPSNPNAASGIGEHCVSWSP